jgi:signal transduction histidine kinase
MAFHDVLAQKREDIIVRWKAQVQRKLASPALPAFEIIDHIPEFLNEIIASLRADAGLPPNVAVGESTTAAGHGAQRLRLGFSLDTVVREYGELHTAILTAASDVQEQPSFREAQIITDATIGGIATSVSEYTRQRDAESQRQANEHFAFIAHELRNPLSSALIAFDLLKGKLPAQERLVGVLERGLHRANELVGATLQITRVASGIELHRQLTTLAAVFEDALLDASVEAEVKGVRLRSTIASDRPISLDTRLIHSALTNVVRNGVKYTPTGEVVELRGMIVNDRAVIEVEDRCGGLVPGEVEAAFAPFVRLDQRQSGFGLGLAIAKQAIDAHGGSIRVQNVPGRNCIFVLEVPAPPVEDEPPSPAH